MPASGGYFVFPSTMARIAAILTWSGVSKSGSPAARAMTSRPALAISIALAAIMADGEALMRLRRRAAMDMADAYRPAASASCRRLPARMFSRP